MCTVNKDVNTRKIALYGGSFDPPHNGHVLSINHLLNSEKIDEVWIIPSGDSRYDKPPIEKLDDRLALLEIVRGEVFSGDDRIKILDLQRDEKFSSSYTIDLVKYLMSEDRDVKYYFVIGADNISGLTEWRSFEELKELVTFLVVPRLGDTLPEPLPDYVENLSERPLSSFSISSSQLRESISLGEGVFGSLPEPLRIEIERRNLYRD